MPVARLYAPSAALALIVSMTDRTAVTKFCGSSSATNDGAIRAMLGYRSGGRVR
jgi:hypothetical protein